MSEQSNVTFADLGLPDHVLQVLNEVGYETPSPIQAQTIPYILDGHDVLGQAQTGTGKTAAFALPLVANIQPGSRKPQALVLAPTRELAIQVAEAFQKYASQRKGFHVLPIYGGQNYSAQIRSLKRGVDVVVGTPGRVMDHMRRGTLDLSELQTLVLDEADEMLRMGFIDDVEWILEQLPEEHQTALFSATMPKEIKRIATNYLNQPKEITIKVKTQTNSSIRQRVWMVSGLHKLDALTRILESEPFDGMIIFVRTKNSTEELADKLRARGYSASALNGDMPQQARVRTVEGLKAGDIDILIATDVAARGLDVERITHVLNYDIPYDTEAYVHRIGRTGRAGRTGDAILFAAPRERRMLKAIERATRQQIEPMQLPTTDAVNDIRIARFKDRITESLGIDEAEMALYQGIVEQYQNEQNVPALEIAAALVKMVQGNTPLLLKERPKRERERFDDRERPAQRRDRDDSRKPRKRERRDDIPMDTYRISVGYEHGVSPKHIVGAIANEAGIESRYIGAIEINDEASTVDLPTGMPDEVFQKLHKTRILGQPINLSKEDGSGAGAKSGDWAPKSKKQGGDKPFGGKKKRSFSGNGPRGGKGSNGAERRSRKPRRFD